MRTQVCLVPKACAFSMESVVPMLDRRVCMKQCFEDYKELSNCEVCTTCYNLSF